MTQEHSSTGGLAAKPDHGHVSHSVKKYKILFYGLLFLTVVTVGLSYVDFGSKSGNFVVALSVASLKAGLVAAIFMHLWGERLTVWKVLMVTAVFVGGLFLLTYLHHSDPIQTTSITSHSSKGLWRPAIEHDSRKVSEPGEVPPK